MNGEPIRQLDAFEEILWLSDRRHVLTAELSTSHGPDQFRAAIGNLNKRHPHLSRVVNKVLGRRPQLRYDAQICPEVVVEACVSLPSLAECAEFELNRPFFESQGALSRWHVYVASNRAVVSLTSHHTLLDGRSHMQLLNEFMLLLTTGEAPDDSALLPSLSELMGVPVADAYVPDRESEDRATIPSPTAPAPKVQVIHHQLPPEVWGLVKECSKAREISLQVTLLGALIAAGRDLTLWDPEGIRCMVPVDERSRIGQENAIGCFFTLHPLEIERLTGRSLWEITPSICELIGQMRNADLSKRFFHEVNAIVRTELTPAQMAKTLRSSYLAHQVMLTNYARYSPRTQFPNARITALLTAGATGGPKTQKVSAATVDGSLRMTLASHQPEKELLKRTAAILESAEP